MEYKYIDFHCHILPGMDFDGTDDVAESVAMCKTLKSQGVATVCATPHFYPWNDDVDAFLARREQAIAALRAEGDTTDIILGAEVQIFQSLNEYPVDRMCIGDSNVIMLEMPEMRFHNWMVTVIENAVYKFNVVPVIAHIERYGYSVEELQKLARIPNVVFQITIGELKYKHALGLLDIVSSLGVPVVLGSDAHNMTDRPPQFDAVTKILEEKPRLFGFSTKKAQAIIQNALYAQPMLEEKICKKATKVTG